MLDKTARAGNIVSCEAVKKARAFLTEKMRLDCAHNFCPVGAKILRAVEVHPFYFRKVKLFGNRENP